MKNFVKVLVASLLLVACLSSFVGCGKSLTKEEIAYKMICYVAEEYEVDASDVTVKSGKLEEEDDGSYFANFKVSVNGYTRYFSGTYDPEADKITYNDVTIFVNMSMAGPGPAYSVTDSFDIEKVNKMLKEKK